MGEVKLITEVEKPDVFGVTETWFRNSSIVDLVGYNAYRRDRSDGRRGGGVIIYVNQKITSYEPIDACFNVSKLEQVWSVLVIGKSKYLIGCIYRPNDFVDLHDINLVFTNARDYVDKNGFMDLLIMGDFNFPNIK